jgi:predicted RecA/RadA family phage recombinase
MRNFVQAGDTVNVLAPYNVTSGNGVRIGALFGVAVTDAVQGESVPIKTTGVFDLPKNTNDAFSVGENVFWDPDNRLCTTGGTLNIGVAVEGAAPGAATVRVRLGPNTIATP